MKLSKPIVEKRILEMVKNHTRDLDKTKKLLTTTAHISSCGPDSLDICDIIADVETEYGIIISSDTEAELTPLTVEKLAGYVIASWKDS